MTPAIPHHRERAAQEHVSAQAARDVCSRLAHEGLAGEHERAAASNMEQQAKRPRVSAGPAALKRDEVDASNLDQTRTAGIASIRDGSTLGNWDDVDDASDASFPSSDPPPQTRGA